MQPELLTPGEVAARLGITRQMVLKYMDDGRIPYITVAGRRLIDAKHSLEKPPPKRPGPKPRDRATD